MRTVTVVLGGEDCEIRELRARKNAKWLKKLEGPLQDVVRMVVEGMGMDDITDGAAMGTLLASVTEFLAGSFDLVLDLLIEYAPELQQRFEDCYTSEAVEAFVQVVQLALPFGDLIKKLGGLRGLGQGLTRPS